MTGGNGGGPLNHAQPGALILVVGASGAGKDTLIDGARRVLEGDARFFFPKREITRPAAAGGEDHVEVSWADFRTRREEGGYCLHWEAHGLGYGAPAAVADEIRRGRAAVLNVSRSVIAEAERRFRRVATICIEASDETRRRRLAARGREDEEDVNRRLARAAAPIAAGNPVRIRNDETREAGVAAFVAALHAAAKG